MTSEYPIVEVVWVDSCDEVSATISFVPRLRPYITRTVGYLIHEDSECISLVAEIETVDPAETRDIEPRAKHIVTIPLVQIKERCHLKSANTEEASRIPCASP